MFFKYRVWILVAGIVILHVSCSKKVRAEEKTRPILVTVALAKYSIFDGIKKEKGFQDWVVVKTTDGGTFYRITKKETVTSEPVSDEIENYFQKVSHTPGRNFYLQESLTYHPMIMRGSGSFIGRIEVRDVQKETILDAWPVIGTLTVSGDVYTSTLNAYIPFFGKQVITRIYKEGEYHLPLFERHELFSSTKPVTEDKSGKFIFEEIKTRDILFSRQ